MGWHYQRVQDGNDLNAINRAINKAKKANDKALELGIYFDGCYKDVDCSCCGDRWDEVLETDGTDVPTFYSKEVKDWIEDERPSGYVHYLDGTVRKFNRKRDMPF
jgi:hypothetical protein